MAACSLPKPPPDYEDLDEIVATNDNGKINQVIANKLAISKVWAGYAAWSFWGQVWYADAERTWHCTTYRHGAPQAHYTAHVLKDLVERIRIESDGE